MPEDFSLTVHDDVPRDEAHVVDEGLGEANDAAGPLHEVQGLSCFARSHTGAVVGGVVGRTWGECCELQQLWVHPAHRGTGMGTRLVKLFEERAIARGCSTFYLETFSFQARPFYERLGYEAKFEIRGFSPGVAKYLMVRMLRRPVDGESTLDREFVTSRVIDAPRERVFKAFSDPARLARWWGPEGFTNTFEKFDLRPGGTWRFVMHGPDGTRYPNESVFVDVVPPQRIVLDHTSGHHFRMTITFAAHGEQTVVGWRQVFDTAAERERIAKIVLEANEQNLDRLAAEVVHVA
jgi:uncharacterized protein YndB with AHSA1/START domain/GNAT superfamily N-acetyltransferase